MLIMQASLIQGCTSSSNTAMLEQERIDEGPGRGSSTRHHSPWTYNTPPTALGKEGLNHLEPESRVVVIGEFSNPKKSNLAWADIGRGVSDSLGKALLNQGTFDVWTNERLASEVRSILTGPTEDRPKRLGRLHKRHANVRFVIVGQVTDFHHTSEVPKELRRRGAFFTKKREAIVAIQFTMVDLEAQRVLVSDHVHGVSGSKKNTDELYGAVAFGSYLFWNSPLGKATEKAINVAMDRVTDIVPTTVQPLRVVKQMTDRKMAVRGDASWGVENGQEFYVCIYDEKLEQTRPVADPHTGQPLRARILSNHGIDAIAWLLGEKPPRVDLSGAELRWDLPPDVAPKQLPAMVSGSE